jgi:hypothetical protein
MDFDVIWQYTHGLAVRAMSQASAFVICSESCSIEDAEGICFAVLTGTLFSVLKNHIDRACGDGSLTAKDALGWLVEMNWRCWSATVRHSQRRFHVDASIFLKVSGRFSLHGLAGANSSRPRLQIWESSFQEIDEDHRHCCRE